MNLKDIPNDHLEWAINLVRNARFSFPAYIKGSDTIYGRILSIEYGEYSIEELEEELLKRKDEKGE
jgi:hypothetical protein